MDNRQYHRSFIILKTRDSGYSRKDGNEAAGYCKIEIRKNQGKLQIYVQDMKPAEPQQAIYDVVMVSQKEEIPPVKLTSIQVPDSGRGEYEITFDPDNLLETGAPIDNFHALAVVYRPLKGDGRLRYPLIGYSDKRVELDWSGSVTDRLEGMYGRRAPGQHTELHAEEARMGDGLYSVPEQATEDRTTEERTTEDRTADDFVTGTVSDEGAGPGGEWAAWNGEAERTGSAENPMSSIGQAEYTTEEGYEAGKESYVTGEEGIPEEKEGEVDPGGEGYAALPEEDGIFAENTGNTYLPEETPEEIPGSLPGETTGQVPGEEVPGEIPGEVPEEIPDQVSPAFHGEDTVNPEVLAFQPPDISYIYNRAAEPGKEEVPEARPAESVPDGSGSLAGGSDGLTGSGNPTGGGGPTGNPGYGAEVRPYSMYFGNSTYWDKVKDYFIRLFDSYKKVCPFNDVIGEVDWIRVDNRNEPLYSYYRMNDSYRGGAGYPDHYLVGLVRKEGRVQYVVYGIPGIYSMVPPMSAHGFSRWLPVKNGYGAGYWLLYIDAISGNIAYPY